MRTGESNPGSLGLRLSGPTAVHDATVAARRFAESAEIDERDASRLAVVVEELVINLYEHGGLTNEDEFELELSATADAISLLLLAPGDEFDPGRAQQDIGIPERGGGAGLNLVRAWADRIDYQREEGRNRLAVLLPRRAIGLS